MATGKVKKWLPDRRIGWVIDDADRAECFFGLRDLRGLNERDVVVGLAVDFERGSNEKGGTARDVRRAGAVAVTPRASQPVARAAPPSANIDLARTIPAPPGVRRVLEAVKSGEMHPGLVLDRYHLPCPQQEQQRDELRKVLSAGGGRAEYPEVLRLWRDLLSRCQAEVEPRETEAPLTLHLARAASFENAGLCLHRVHGFAYLPGSGLKGMARAYAETVWLPRQPEAEQKTACEQIQRVFGWAGKTSSAGSVVFHDAWPEAWPELLVDVVNNHHPEYYQGKDSPGDWDSPNPVYFLAVKPGTKFLFPLAARRAGEGDVKQARQWLDGALRELGCGAKTAAGYGYFASDKSEPEHPTRRRFAATLELVTPAFLAGADQQEADCVLRPATLRGLLRWWWRTLHVGFVEDDQLRLMEAAVWGDTSRGGAVTLKLKRIAGPAPAPCPYKKADHGRPDQLVIDEAFLRAHGIPLGPRRMTQGISYAGYGMDEVVRENQEKRRKRRWFAAPGTTWRLELVARPGGYREGIDSNKKPVYRRLEADVLLEQAKAALWWLCELGGVGSKSRKGFGSFARPAELNGFEGQKAKTLGGNLREACGLPREDYREDRVRSASIRQMLNLSDHALNGDWLRVQTPWSDPWRALDEIGVAMQAFAQSSPDSGHGKHCDDKRYLGLPRKLHGPLNKPLAHQSQWTPPIDLSSSVGDRHSSPALFHVGKGNGGLTISLACFPTAELRPAGAPMAIGWEGSRRVLGEMLAFVNHHLRGA